MLIFLSKDIAFCEIHFQNVTQIVRVLDDFLLSLFFIALLTFLNRIYSLFNLHWSHRFYLNFRLNFWLLPRLDFGFRFSLNFWYRFGFHFRLRFSLNFFFFFNLRFFSCLSHWGRRFLLELPHKLLSEVQAAINHIGKSWRINSLSIDFKRMFLIS